ncbi:TonB-dependent receptor [Dyadobacter psychrotolerans]|uniref:SusC/RagA family TonB-linked outer membrane protein n=1 Tax=Dyadobacter psychrotolerans TaxID=2541721 RepID=A0A4R5DJY5_9BACT|nr:TonB-dependent receptor [Dyadobacter psychrotolerans]TDE14442.1 SusC/RagA family TonB-linked outer membrane protein [Dyadobacter psychrotolerans]
MKYISGNGHPNPNDLIMKRGFYDCIRQGDRFPANERSSVRLRPEPGNYFGIVLALLVLMLTVQPAVYSFPQGITLSGKNIPLEKVIHQITQKSGYSFVYNVEWLKKADKIDLNIRNKNLEGALAEIFKNQPFTYQIVGKTVVLKLKEITQSSVKTTLDTTTVRILGRVLEVKDPPAPLPGATVAIKGLSQGTITDERGVFELRAPRQSVLVISMVGYKTQEYIVRSETANLIISLPEDLQVLDQVVVTGFATQKVREIASSVSIIKMENIENKPVTQLSQALQGGGTGIQVSQSTGLVGGDQANIRVRGVGTVGNAAPLVLVDGVPFDMNNLDPNTISSITVLKDAASASMYGARGANGVILITTKRGVAGVPNIEYNGFWGIQKPVYRPDFVDAATWMEMNNQASINSGGGNLYRQGVIDSTRSGADPIRYPDTRWADLILRKSAPIEQHSILVSGGNTAARFSLSVNHTRQVGHLKELGAMQSDYKRTTVRANTTVDLLKNLFVYMDVFASRSDQNEPNANGTDRNTSYVYGRLYIVSPNIVSKYPDKPQARPNYSYYGNYGESWNPTALLEKGGRISRSKDEAIINMRPQWEIIPNLKLNAQVSYRVTSGLNRVNQDPYIFFDYFTERQSGVSYVNTKTPTLTGRENYLYFGSNLDYRVAVGKHNLNAIAGYTQELRTYDSWNDVAIKSVFAKAYYTYGERYLLEAAIRRDGSSLFGTGNKWGYFPSVAVGWNIDQESFFKVPAIPAWKIRASYGTLGNNSINPYLYQTTINADGTEQIIGNTDLKWEKSNVLNVATDIGFKNGLDLTLEWFDKTTKDVLITAQPLYTGAIGVNNTMPPVNTASVQIRGMEANLKYNTKIGSDLNFTFGIGYTRNKSKILKLIGDDKPIIIGNTIMRIGGSMMENYGYATQGLLREQDITDGGVVKLPGQKAGDIHFKDTNNDGIISDLDRVPLGSTQPVDIFFGSIGLKYRNFDFDALVSGQAGTPRFYSGLVSIPLNVGGESGTPQKYHMNYWTPENPNAPLPRLTLTPGSNNNFSDFFQFNGAFARVRYIQFGYTLPKGVIGAIRGKSLRFYFNAQNPFTFSKVKLIDPETGGNQTTVPLMKVISGGLNVRF